MGTIADFRLAYNLKDTNSREENKHGYKEKGSKKEEALTSRIREPSCKASRKKHLSRGFLLCGA
jgi:hypothetical protein